MLTPPRVTAVQPRQAIEHGRVDILGDCLADRDRLPEVRVGDRPARVVCVTGTRLGVLVPTGIEPAGPVTIRVADVAVDAGLRVGTPLASGLHQVDSPVFDRHGNLYVTYSGTRGQQVPVSIFRVRPDGTRETYSSGVVNPTSMAIGPDDRLYVSSRFEGTVYRLHDDGSAEPFATDLGIACGLAFAPDGTLYVGDRSGTIFAVDRRGRASGLASLPPSVAAFHLALRPDGVLVVAGPTLSSYDVLHEVEPDGRVRVRPERFGRPQGMAVDAQGGLLVTEALAGASGLYRLSHDEPELVLAGAHLIGVATSPVGGLVVCSNDTAYRIPPPA